MPQNAIGELNRCSYLFAHGTQRLSPSFISCRRTAGDSTGSFFNSHLEQIMHINVILTSAILAGCVNAQFSLHFGTNAPAPAQISGKNHPFNTIYFKDINVRGMIGKLSWSSRIFRGNALNTSMLIRSRIGYSEEASNMADCSKKMIKF